MFMVADKELEADPFRKRTSGRCCSTSKNDPNELVDLGDSEDHGAVIDMLYDKLFAWACRPAARTTLSNSQLISLRTKTGGKGVMIGVVDETDVPPEFTAKYRGRKASDHRKKWARAGE